MNFLKKPQVFPFFCHKRKDATRRLDQAQENLVRLLDILGELESRVEPLRKQSEKAQKFITLSDEKKTLENRCMGK